MYSIYDSKAEQFNDPFIAATHGVALRIFASHVANPETIWAQYPSDFTLFYVGEFDPEKGAMHKCATPVSLGLASEHVTIEES